jgi:hypothetical protein
MSDDKKVLPYPLGDFKLSDREGYRQFQFDMTIESLNKKGHKITPDSKEYKKIRRNIFGHKNVFGY